jgi:DNA-binding GntR family transcriptional regulator
LSTIYDIYVIEKPAGPKLETTAGGSSLGRSGGRASIAPPSIPELVCAELRKWIASGELKPGPRKITELARHFGVSGMPIREALRRLEAEGFVSFDHNRSVRVNALSIDDIREIFLARKALESVLIEQAAPVVAQDADLLHELESQIELMDETSEDVVRWREANEAFHSRMYGAIPLPRITAMVQGLRISAEPFLRLYASTAEGFSVAQDEHRELLDRLREGDGVAASSLLRTHLTTTLQVVEARLRGLSGPVAETDG